MKKHLLLVAAMSAVVANISAQESAIVLYENFSSADAFPVGWEVINSTPEMATLKDGVFSWRVAPAPDDFPKPIDGDKVALIYQASYTDGDGKRVELSQDEWLITPSIELGSDPQLTFGLSYVPMFLYNCSNEYLDFTSDPLDFSERVPATTLKVMVRADGADDWDEVYDVFDFWQGYTLDELMSKYYSRDFRDNEVDLGAYSGKKVRLGFRFAGYMGNAMALDAVKVTSSPDAGINAVEADRFADGERISVVSISGVEVADFIAGHEEFDRSMLAPGIYILSGATHTVKIAVK